MSEQPFVNRRGRPIFQEDLDDLSIDGEKISPDPPVAVKQQKKPKKQRPSMTKRRKFVVVALVVAVLLSPLVVGEVVRLSYDNSVTGAKENIQRLTQSTVLPLQKKTNATAAQVQHVAEQLGVIRDGLCPGGAVDNVAGLYSRAKEALRQCTSYRVKVASLALSVKELGEQAGYLETIAPLMSSVTVVADDQYAVLSAQAENWKTLFDKLSAVTPPTSLRTAHERLVEYAKQVSSQWTALDGASHAQDMTAFKEAENNLGESYAAVRAVADDVNQAVATTQKHASDTAKQLN